MLNTADAIRQRRAVRGFRPDPVPSPLLREIFELAQRAPSNCNTQPWLVELVSGDKLAQLKQRLEQTKLQEFQDKLRKSARTDYKFSQ